MAPVAVRETGLATLSGPTMGTYFRILLPDAGGIAGALEVKAVETLAQVDSLMSTYRADSEVSRFNATGVRSLVQTSAQTGTVMDEALRIGALTGGPLTSRSGRSWSFGDSALRAGQRRFRMRGSSLEPPSAWGWMR